MQTESTMREKTFNMRFSGEEWAKLQGIAKAKGITAAEFVRRCINTEFRDLGHFIYERMEGRAVQPTHVLEDANAANWNQIRSDEARRMHEALYEYLPEYKPQTKPAKKGAKK